MARELNVRGLLATTMVALTVALTAAPSSNAPCVAMAAKGSAGEGNTRLPGTLPSGAPIKMPELEGLSVSLPFSLRKQLGLTNITDVVQSFASGAFCESAGKAGGKACDISGAAEKATRSKHTFHDLNGYGEGVTLQHILETTDETFLIFIYDSLDANSYRNAAMVDTAAGMLKGYVTTVGIDIRRDDLQWILNSWNIQLAPSLRLLRPTRMMATTRQGLKDFETIASTVGNSGSHLLNNLNAALSPSYSLFAGAKHPLDIAPGGNQMAMLRQEAWSPEAIKKFALGGGKSLESENTIETLQGGDKAAETVYDLLRGAHPLTFMGKDFMGNGAQLQKEGYDAFTAGALTSTVYTRRAQVPKAVVILFTDKDGALANLYKALALRYNNRAVFVTVNGKEKAPQLAAAFGVTSFPTFAVVKPPQSAYTAFDLRQQLITGEFSKKRKDGKDVFALIKELLATPSSDGGLTQTVRLFTPAEGTTLSINTLMTFMDEKQSEVSPISLSGIIPATTLHTYQRQATRDAYYYQQARTNDLVTPITTANDWDNLVYLNAGVVASGPSVANPAKAPTVTVGLIFTPTADGEVSPIIRQELADVRGRLKDNYFVSIPKAKAMETLQYFKQKCVLAGETPQTAESVTAEAGTTTDVVFLYARLQPLSSAAAGGLSANAAAAAFSPNFIIDYSCRTTTSEADNTAMLSSAMKIDKMVHYGAKKGFSGFGGSEVPPASFDWSEVPKPKL